jgi:ubiquinone biosynthesis monooxygenase Coq7
MWDQEKKHIATFDKIVLQHGVRPTFLYPLWKVAAFSLGAGTAMMGRRTAMACTEAVETMIGEHYDSFVYLLSYPSTYHRLMEGSNMNRQLKSISDPVEFPSNHPSIVLLRKILTEFRDDELEHLDTAIANDSQKAPIHALLSAVIAGGCKVAIAATERV